MKALIVSFALVAVSVVSANAQTPSPGSNLSGSGEFCLKSGLGRIRRCAREAGAAARRRFRADAGS